MIIILIGPGMGFPNGYAPTLRTSLYARGIKIAGGEVRVLCLGPSEYPNIGILNRDAEGIEDGVEFEYTCGTPIRGRTRLQQVWLVLKGLFLAAWRILQLNKTKGVNAMILYSDRGIAILLYWFIAKLCRTKYIYERCEQPFYQAEYSFFWKAVSYIYTHTLFRLFDGAIVISDYLWEYMRERMRPGTGLLKIPILIDVYQQSLALSNNAQLFGRYIAYCGSWIETKDGIRILMKAFANICDEFPDLKLVLIGDSIKTSNIPTYHAYAEELAISQRVIFTGLVPRNDLLSYLANASILALAKPFSRQSEAGFPTKLGEYLATGKPVLVTKTGEIGTYLEDNINVFFAPPNDVSTFAERIRYILLHPEESAVIGRRGQEAALSYFDYKENGLKIKAFIDQLCREN